MTDEIPTENFRAALKDMAARRYMNALGALRSENVREAMFEAGAGHALQQMRMMVDYHEENGEWPADTPNETYVSFVEAMEQSSGAAINEPSGKGVH